MWKIADIIQENLETLARAETWDNGKPIRESMAADLPLAVDHFRYVAGVIRAEEGGATEIDANTLAIKIKEPLGVVAAISGVWWTTAAMALLVAAQLVSTAYVRRQDVKQNRP